MPRNRGVLTTDAPLKLTTVNYCGDRVKARVFDIPIPMSFYYMANKSGKSLIYHVLEALKEYENAEKVRKVSEEG